MGVGTIIYGRKGKANRFALHYSLKQVGQMAIDGKQIDIQRLTKPIVVKLSKKTQEAVEHAVKPSIGNVKLGSKFVFIPLRQNLDIEFNIPADFNKSEADRICSALQRLAK